MAVNELISYIDILPVWSKITVPASNIYCKWDGPTCNPTKVSSVTRVERENGNRGMQSLKAIWLTDSMGHFDHLNISCLCHSIRC